MINTSPVSIPSLASGIDDTLSAPLLSYDRRHCNRDSKQEYFHALLEQHAVLWHFLESLAIVPGSICLCAIYKLVESRGSPQLQHYN